MITLELKDVRDEKSLIVFGNDFFERSAKAKRLYEQQWLLNIAFLAGDQLTHVNRHTGALEHVNIEYDPEWYIRTVNNRILPVYRTMTAKLTKNRPLPSAKANSREDSDIQAARAAVKLLEHHWHSLGLEETHPEMISWLVATGNGFYKQFWDPTKGERIIDLEGMDAEAGLTPDGKPQLKPEARGPVDFTLGDTSLVFRSPFHIYPQPGKVRMKDMRIFGDAEIMDVDEILEIYGKEVSPERDTALVRISNSLENTIMAGSVQERQSERSSIVKELYILPCKQFPGGAVVRWANEVLLSIEEECPEIPISHFGLIDIPGRFWHKGIVDDLVPIQRRWNQLLSKIEMHNDYYNDPPIIMDPGTVDLDQWTNEPGLVLEKKNVSNANPYVMPVPQLDPAIFKELEVLDAQFEIVPVINKVSYGRDTSNAKSGVAINFLQEKDDDVIRPLIELIEASYAQVFKRDFKLCQENYEEDRGFAIVGEDNKVEWVEFKKADLESSVDVGVEPGSAMPRSKVAQQAMVMDMLEAGFFTNPQTGQPDYAKALKYMEFGSVDDIYQDNALDANQANREHEKIKDGVEAWPEEWHNHEAHVYEHNRLRKTADYENWEPQLKDVLAAHIAVHLEFMRPPPQPQPVPTQSPGADMGALMQSLPPEVQQLLTQLPPEQVEAFLMLTPEQQAQELQTLVALAGQPY